MDWMRVAAGALTGLVVGVTGVGGGALMTPMLLLLFNTAPLTAVGTDLWFAAITKLVITGLHHRRRLIDWEVVRTLWLGSLPTSTLTIALLKLAPSFSAPAFVTVAIGVAIAVTAAGLLAQPWLHGVGLTDTRASSLRAWQRTATIAAGAGLGLVVTLTSVGAGALGAVCLLYLYPTRLPVPRLVATDIAHATLLAVFAGLGHLVIGNVDGTLLLNLLLGSIPAAILGAVLSSRMPPGWLRVALAIVLLFVAAKLIMDFAF
jgi:uncharacterized membrane protein YfcA